MANEGFFVGYVVGSPNKRVFNVAINKVEVVCTTDTTSYSVPLPSSGSEGAFDHDKLFKSCNIPFMADAYSKERLVTQILYDEEEATIPMSSNTNASKHQTSSVENGNDDAFYNPFSHSSVGMMGYKQKEHRRECVCLY